MPDPTALASFIGQSDVTFNLTVECEAAERDGRMPDHILLEGPAGLGKTRLARAVAARYGYRVVEIPATALGNVKDTANALVAIGSPDDGPAVVVVDEIHGVVKKGQPLFLSAMTEGWIQPSGAKDKIFLAPFIMIGATTNPGQLSRPMMERFTVRESLDFYSAEEIEQIIRVYADAEGYVIDETAVRLIAAVGRGTPRIVCGLVRRIARFAQVADQDVIDRDVTEFALERLGIDQYGLEPMDRKILKALCDTSVPTGLETLAAMIGVENDAVKNREWYLLRLGMVRRPRGGRVATKLGYRALNLDAPITAPA
jgi:Holliday junction DNA helicase RuvB